MSSELEQARPQTSGEEELQLQLALAMSREVAEQVGARQVGLHAGGSPGGAWVTAGTVTEAGPGVIVSPDGTGRCRSGARATHCHHTPIPGQGGGPFCGPVGELVTGLPRNTAVDTAMYRGPFVQGMWAQPPGKAVWKIGQEHLNAEKQGWEGKLQVVRTLIMFRRRLFVQFQFFSQFLFFSNNHACL